jgi:predicted ATPase/DNA-binding winged helix-turn-helix (wHTH) protein
VIFSFENCELDLARLVLRRDGAEVHVEPQVFDLLRFLVERRGGIVTKQELLEEVWGTRFVSDSALTTRMKTARQAIGDDGTAQRLIRTVHGKGYEFVGAVGQVAGPQWTRSPGPPRQREDAAASSSRLPAAVQPLIGRAEVLEELVATLAANRLVTLAGPGGVGKTSVGYEVARRVEGNYPDGVFTVELVTVVDDGATLEAFATALDVNMRQQVSIDDAIIDLLRPRRALLLLDNCEHVLDPLAALVNRILRSAPGVSILATSREPLAVASEHVWGIEPLAFEATDGLDPTHLRGVPAVALFVERAVEADPGFRLDATTAPAVLEICRRLDGVPLAIELAAARARAIDVTEIARRLDERFRLLRGGRRGSDPRHRTLIDAISWSYDLLSKDEQRLFASLAVFAGQFDLDAAERVCDGEDVLDLLTRLAERSMVVVRRPGGGGTRYELLETLREYGRSRLDRDGSVEAFTSHAAHYVSVARSVEADMCTADEGGGVARADAAFADLRTAQRFAVQVEDFDDAFGLIGSMREYAMRTMRYEVFAWADTAARAEGGLDHPLHPLIAGIQAYGSFVRGEFDTALALARDARLVEGRRGLTPSGLVERVLANVLFVLGDVQTGLAEAGRQLELAEAAGSGSRLAHACYMRSVAASSIGDYEEATRLVLRAREAGRRTGSPTDLASASVAEAFAAHDDDLHALQAFAAADELAQSAGNRWMTAFARTEASALLVHRGDLAAGCAGLAEMVDTWYRAGEWSQQWHTLSRCVIALDRIGQPELAAQLVGAIEAHATMGTPPVMVTLRDLVLRTRSDLVVKLGTDHVAELHATGAALPVAEVVHRARQALLGRPLDG